MKKIEIRVRDGQFADSLIAFLDGCTDVTLVDPTPDTPAPAAPYEMLGEIKITHDDCGSGFAHHIRLDGRVMTGGMSKGEENLFFPLIHEHSFVTETLALLKNLQSCFNKKNEITLEKCGTGSIIDAILARLNAGPEKGV